jgi:Amt family ammonium transporter
VATGISAGDTAWVLASAAMVMLMTPGLALFYGGLVRRKNVLSVMMYCLGAYAIVTLLWVVIGFSEVFARDVHGFIGGLEYAGLRGLGVSAVWPGTHIPGLVFAVFRSVFAAIATAIIASAIAEKGRVDSWLLFSALWLLTVYAVIGHWLWGGGWASRLGAIDFAGGIVVHIASGFSALALALVAGKRRIDDVEPVPHNLPLVLTGMGLLWFGWLGFNAGSALAANGVAANALLVTNVAAAAGGLAWALTAWLNHGRPGSVAFASGAVAGLVAITPAAGYVGPIAAMVIGGVAGMWSYYWVSYRIRHGIDEVLDAWAVHGMSGVWGSIATAIFADPSVNSVAGLVYGNIHLFLAQLAATAASVAWAFTVSYIIARLVGSLMGWRVPEQAEYVGLDLSELGEEAYETLPS